ncbi:unnamed protein product, partial [Mesorhabditis belari]|uniref:Guanylate-binding protein N-terminal domain-containing protein n=1 Tax=Mesorhabditis belari TaxID=2138241 RepID=A0AAF3FGP3_9BILA
MSRLMETPKYNMQAKTYDRLMITLKNEMTESNKKREILETELKEKSRPMVFREAAANLTSFLFGATSAICVLVAPATGGATIIVAFALGASAVGSGSVAAGFHITGNIQDARRLSDEIAESFKKPIRILNAYERAVNSMRQDEENELKIYVNRALSQRILSGFFRVLNPIPNAGVAAAVMAARTIPSFRMTAAAILPGIGENCSPNFSAACDALFLGLNIKDLYKKDTSRKANELQNYTKQVDHLIEWVERDVKRRKVVYLYDSFVAIIGVCGKRRTGKSLLLEMIRKLSKNEKALDDPKTRLSDHKGIRFKASDDSHTTNIEMWSEPFIINSRNSKKKFAILLVDTPGIAGDEASPEVHNFTITFMTMFCDILIYNAKNFDMENLKSLAEAVAVTNKEKPQKIGYIVSRDMLGHGHKLNHDHKLGHDPEYFKRDGIRRNHPQLLKFIEEGFKKIKMYNFPKPPEWVQEASHIDEVAKVSPPSQGKHDETDGEETDSGVTSIETLPSFDGDPNPTFGDTNGQSEFPDNNQQRCNGRLVIAKAAELTENPAMNLMIIREYLAQQTMKSAESFMIVEMKKICGNDMEAKLRRLDKIHCGAKRMIRERLAGNGTDYVEEKVKQFVENFASLLRDKKVDILIARLKQLLDEQRDQYLKHLGRQRHGEVSDEGFTWISEKERTEDEGDTRSLEVITEEDKSLMRREHVDGKVQLVARRGEFQPQRTTEKRVEKEITSQDTLIEENFEMLLGNSVLSGLRKRLVAFSVPLAQTACEDFAELGKNYEAWGYHELVEKMKLPNVCFQNSELGMSKLKCLGASSESPTKVQQNVTL